MAADFAQEIMKLLDSRTIANRKKTEEHIKTFTDRTHLGKSYSEYEVDTLLRDLGQSILKLHQEFSTRDNLFFAREIAKMVALTTEKWSSEIDRLTEEVNYLNTRLAEKENQIRELDAELKKK